MLQRHQNLHSRVLPPRMPLPQQHPRKHAHASRTRDPDAQFRRAPAKRPSPDVLLGGRREGGAWRVSVLLAFVRSGGVWRDRAVAVVHHGHGLPERVDVVEEQLQRVQVARIVPVPAQRARQFRGDLPRRGDGAVAVDGPGGQEPVWTRDEGRADGCVAVVEFVELHEVQHVGFDRCVERVGREGDVGDRVAVYSRLAAWGVRERVGCQADVYGGVGEVRGEWGGEYRVPVAGGGGGVG